MNSLLAKIHALRWYKRLPVKWATLGLTYFVVCFPFPVAAWRHFQRLSDPNALIQPDALSLQPWVEELRVELPADLSPQDAFQRVEAFVYRKVPYEWDWNTWGLVDYFPTVDEIVSMGKEDCDGRAITAASLLRKFGYDARLVTNFAHMWVSTPQGELMSPGRARVFEATEKGMRMQLQGDALGELPRATMYGISVFPLDRELLILLVLWTLLLRPGGGIGPQLVALVFLVNALLFFRLGVLWYDRQILWRHMIGVGNLLAAVIALYGWARVRARERGQTPAVVRYPDTL